VLHFCEAVLKIRLKIWREKCRKYKQEKDRGDLEREISGCQQLNVQIEATVSYSKMMNIFLHQNRQWKHFLFRATMLYLNTYTYCM
jgi:hypothetical protein